MPGYNFYGNPVDYQPPAAAPAAPPPKPAGPTGFWQRIGAVGTQALHDISIPGNKLGGAIYSPLAKEQNRAADQENATAKQITDMQKSGKATKGALATPGVNFKPTALQSNAARTQEVTDKASLSNSAKSVGKSLLQLPNDLVQGAKKNFGADSRNTQTINGMDTITALNKAKDITKSGKFSKQTVDMINAPTSGKGFSESGMDSTMTLVKAITDPKATDQSVQATIAKINQHDKEQGNKFAGDTLMAASAGVLGPEDVAAAGGAGLAKAAVINAAAGGVGGVGSELASNPNANKKELLTAGGTGAVIGAATTGLSAGAGKLVSASKAALNKDKSVTNLITKSKTNALLKKGEAANAAENATKSTVKNKLLTAGEKQPVRGEGFTMSETADKTALATGKEITRLEGRLTKFQQGKLNITPEQAKAEAQQLSQLRSGKMVANAAADVKTAASHKAIQTSGAAVDTPIEQSISGKLVRPVKAAAKEELVNTNKAAAKGVVSRFSGEGSFKTDATVNPELHAARQGNTDFSNALRDASSRQVTAQANANTIAEKFSQLFKKSGKTADEFIADINSKNSTSEAHDFWTQHYKALGGELQAREMITGARGEGYVPVRADMSGAKPTVSTGGLKKTGGFSKGRQTTVDELGNVTDKYATHAEAKKAIEAQGGKVLSDPVALLHQDTGAKLKAIANHDSIAAFDKTAMRDGRAATITFDQKKGLAPGYRDYNTTLLPGRAVHPEAVKGIEALTKSTSLSQNQVINKIAKINSVSKMLTTLNGVVHGKNFALASIREQGLRSTAAAMHDAGLASEEDWSRAYSHGMVSSRAGVTNIYDMANEGRGPMGEVTSRLGKLHSASQRALFEGFGDKLGITTYKHVESNLIKQGIEKEEAGKIAADAANRVMFTQRATESTPAIREASRLALFAGNYFKSTLSAGTKAIGLAKNNALTEGAQKAEQRQAAKALARGFTYMFGAAQALNYATTGHSTFQNKDSKLSPVFYVDKSTGKEYHITNWYGQIGDLLHLASNPVKEMTGKSSPVLQESARLISGVQGGTDPFTGNTVIDRNASGARQTAQAFANALEHFATPLGFQYSQMNRTFGAGGQPGVVSGVKLLGYGTSTSDQNTMEKDISARYSSTLPRGQGQAQDQQLATAEAKARQDMKKGNPNSDNVKFVQSKLSPTSFKKFQNTGTTSDTQRHFESLPTEQKLQIIKKYSPDQLKELDMTSLVKSLTGSSAKTTVESLQQKGYTPDQINQLLQKAGYGQSQMQQIKQEAKVQARQQSAKTRYQPKWNNPLLK